MYFGEAHTVLDEKGRITLPRRFRQAMEVMGHDVWYMARGFDASVSLFPPAKWEKIRTQANAHPLMDAFAGDFRRLFYGSATQVRPDRQGRMPVAPQLREHAGLEKAAVLIGVDDHLELWSEENWRQFQQDRGGEFRQMATELFATRVKAGEAAASESQA